MDALTIGSLTLDLFFQDESLTLNKERFTLALGGKYVVSKFSEGVGGGGGNIAVGLARAGIKTGIWTQVEESGVGKLVTEKLAEEQVDLSLLEKRREILNLSVILLSQKGERTIINHRAGSLKLQFNETHKQVFSKLKLLYLGNMPEMSIAERAQILKFANQSGVRVALNLGVKDCRLRLKNLSSLFQNLDFFLINRYELADILGIQPNELLLNRVSYNQRLGLPDTAILVVTDGEFGSYGFWQKEIFYQKALVVPKVLDTTGAGDAFTSGFLAAMYYQKSLEEALLSGAKNSASVIGSLNATTGLLNQEQLF